MYNSNITIDNVVKSLSDFIEPFVENSQRIRAQTNRVAMPKGSCIVLTELLQVDLSTPQYDYDGTALNLITPKRIDVQLDFYGDKAGDYCTAVKTVYRSSYAPDNFPDGIKPLYCSDGIQSPLVSGEEQYVSRWTLTCSLQYNPVVTVPQDYADTLSANITNVEAKT